MERTQKAKKGRLRLRDLTYERFIETTNRFAVAIILRAKRSFPTANDPAFAQDLSLRGVRLNIYEAPDGPAKEALDVFDISYKLGLPITGTLISILRHTIRAWWQGRTSIPKLTRRFVLKKWKSIPLPWLDHIELYENDKLKSRRYIKRGSISDVSVNSSRLYGSYEGNLLQSPSLYTLWRYLISVYAARKLDRLYEEYSSGEQPLALHQAQTGEIADEVEATNPVSTKGPQLKKMTHYLSQKNLAELFVMLEWGGHIDQASAAVIKRMFHRTHSIQKYLKPGLTKGSSKRTYPDLFTPDYVRLFENLPPNPEKIID